VSFQAVTPAARADSDLGDGTQAPGRVVHHAYAEPGDCTVTLTATDTASGEFAGGVTARRL
jgi:PKD repeat protein